jgi:methylase of polypeptide subunit release factors
MDVGGGVGELMGAVLKEHPTLRGIVFDLPSCAEAAVKNVSEAGVVDRSDFIAGSFFEPRMVKELVRPLGNHAASR